ncbi:MAG: BREX system ATP-binding domain-containing protein [Candidatus Hodarchaeota archaeon]
MWEKYLLKRQPFDIFKHTHEMADRREEWDRIMHQLRSALGGEGCRFLILQGDYGMGKSFMLEQIYVKTKKGDIPRAFAVKNILAGAPIRAMASEPITPKFGLDLVCRLFSNIKVEEYNEIFKRASLERLDSEAKNVFNAFKSGQERESSLFDITKDIRRIVISFLKGESLKATELGKIGVRSPLKDSPTAMSYFFNFLKVLKQAEYDSMLILLDEFEYIMNTQGEKKITQILNTFKEIFDDFGLYEGREQGQRAKVIFFFAISPGGWEKLLDLRRTSVKKTGGGGIAPFLDRISNKDIIGLKPFYEEDTFELVRLRLEENRTNTPQNPFFPFTNACIKLVYSVSENNPRHILEYCGILLEDALDVGLSEIDEKSAKEILGKYGIDAEHKS